MTQSSNPLWSQIWQQLAVMLDAGLTIEKAVQTLVLPAPKTRAERRMNAVLERMYSLTRRGMGLSDAVRRAGAMDEFDLSLLRTAETAGRLPDGLNAIAQRRLAQIQRVATLSTSLWLPQLLLLIGGFAALLVRVARGDNLLPSLVEISCWVVGARIVTVLFLGLLGLDPRVYLSKLWPLSWLRKHSLLFQSSFELTFFSAFLWQIRAGVAVEQVTKNCKGLLSNKAFQGTVDRVAQAMSQGLGVADSLIEHGLILSKRLRMTVNVAEQSGRWEQAIEQELGLRAAAITQSVDAKFKWIPRVYYVLALVVVAKLMA